MKVTITLWACTPKGERGLSWMLALAIWWWTGSPWSHVGVSIDGWYIEARAFQGVVGNTRVPAHAVRIRSWRADADWRMDIWERHQLGKPYDWPGIFGFIIGPSKGGRADRGKWFCSELATVILRQYGIAVCENPLLGSKIPAWEITPGELVEDCR